MLVPPCVCGRASDGFGLWVLSKLITGVMWFDNVAAAMRPGFYALSAAVACGSFFGVCGRCFVSVGSNARTGGGTWQRIANATGRGSPTVSPSVERGAVEAFFSCSSFFVFFYFSSFIFSFIFSFVLLFFSLFFSFFVVSFSFFSFFFFSHRII